jgi:hypothetical protein
MSTSFWELSDFGWPILNSVQRKTKVLGEVSRGYRVRSDVTRKTQLHENIKLHYLGNYCGMAVNYHGKKFYQHLPIVANLNTAVIYR